LTNEIDDRLAGDPVWELFPRPSPRPARRFLTARDSRRWLAVACLIAFGWVLFPPLAVIMACLAFSFRDFQIGRQLSRSIPDKAGGTICARFAFAWAAWKLGLAGFLLIFVFAIGLATAGERLDLIQGLSTSVLLWMSGFTLSAVFTATGLVKAYRTRMRVWIGEGVNQARTLMLGMLIVTFTFVVLGPFCLGLVGIRPRAGGKPGPELPFLLGLLASMFAGPVAILLVLDWLSRRVVADRPGKFGPKVPTVGKWNS
jgi:hypothetical protein